MFVKLLYYYNFCPNILKAFLLDNTKHQQDETLRENDYPHTEL